MLIHGWGRYPVIEASASLPHTLKDLQSDQIFQTDESLIARGLGRSYGDSALNQNVISSSRLNLVKRFDIKNGVIACDAGVSLADLLNVIVPHGWFLPVTPGTKYITVGGAIASDVHGKNHHLEGCFSEFVDSFCLLTGDGQLLQCSKQINSDLFRATCGGMGLTGVVAEATLRLKRISSSFVESRLFKAPNLKEALELFEQHHATTYAVAWIDCLAKKKRLGRSVLMLGEHAQGGGLVQTEDDPRLSIPCNMPSALLNKYSIKLFNALYYQRVRVKDSKQRVHYHPYFYPLDSIGHWNRMYGKNGFTQYQCVIPKAAGREGITRVVQAIADSGKGSFLAVLKVFGAQNFNYLSFPIEGYTLALDFKIEPGLFKLLDDLDAIVLDYGGRLYLAKDVRMSEHTFKKSYPNWESFQEIRARFGSLKKFSSLQSQRLGL
jgi:FAD/FMN-containing dehydrogenase